MAERRTKLPEIVKAHEREILTDWTARQLESSAMRRDLMNEAELQRQSQEFLTAFVKATDGGIEDLHSGNWSAVNDVLGRISKSRALQGFSPSETATSGQSIARLLITQIARLVASTAYPVSTRRPFAVKRRGGCRRFASRSSKPGDNDGKGACDSGSRSQRWSG